MEKCETYGGCWNPPAKEKPLSPSDATACLAGSMLRCYMEFLEYFPWKKSEFPTYDLLICSDADDARIFRQGGGRPLPISGISAEQP